MTNRFLKDLTNDDDLLDRAHEVTVFGKTRLSLYMNARASGSPHVFAAMIALQHAPRVMTDNVFFEGIGTLDKQFGDQPEYLNHITREAKKHGYNPNANDYYEPYMARFPGDPTAFIPATGGRAHVKSVLKAQGRGCHGVMEFDSDAGQVAPIKKIPLGEDIIQRNVKRLQKDPDKARKPVQELREEVLHKHGAK